MTDAAVDTSDLRVFIVDDDEAVRESTELLLRLQGYATESAGDGRQALERVVAFRPELVLLDIGMPRMDGYQVARRMLELDFPSPPLLVAVTAFTHAEASQRCAEAGFDYKLHKPVDFDVFDRLVLLLQENHRLRRQMQWQVDVSDENSRGIIRLAIHMASTLLDVASTTCSSETRERCLRKAHKALDDAGRWLNKRSPNDQELRTSLIRLTHRLIGMRG